jgi:hypothetical protein
MSLLPLYLHCLLCNPVAIADRQSTVGERSRAGNPSFQAAWQISAERFKYGPVPWAMTASPPATRHKAIEGYRRRCEGGSGFSLRGHDRRFVPAQAIHDLVIQFQMRFH